MRNFSECVRKYSPATGHMWKPKRQHTISDVCTDLGFREEMIICYGLEPSIGIFHHSELNNYNLADDMIEPFRPLVDLYVSSHFDISEIDSTLTPEMKKGLFGIINFDMSVKGDMRIVSNCIDMLIASYSSALQGNRTELDLPELIQLQVHSYE